MNDNNITRLAQTTIRLARPLLLGLIIAMVASSLAACSSNSSVSETASMSAQPTQETPVVTQASGSIYLYGEAHGMPRLWTRSMNCGLNIIITRA
ncbi:hypothetical protein [Paenibacillus sp. FSL R10-2736]|uniref:hypothetical protein n=1 Tax=Paenibacillus sp. FSL R10-2736 TaxID=2954692 RepID=UPI0030F50797